LADYLEQQLTRHRRIRPFSDRVWEALRAHTRRADDLQASPRPQGTVQVCHAEALYRAAAAAGDPGALRSLAWWLSERPGRQADAEAGYREAAAAGDPDALRLLARWLGKRQGQQALESDR
jgi:TPR repeat protein